MNPMFSQVKPNNIPYNRFDKSHVNRYSIPACKVVPALVMELNPGDKVSIDNTIFARVNPLTHPIFGDVDVYTSFFFVPRRIIDDQFDMFYTGGPKGEVVINMPSIPWINIGNSTSRSVIERMGYDNPNKYGDFSAFAAFGNWNIANIPNLPSRTTGGSPFFMIDGKLMDYLGYPTIPDSGDMEEQNLEDNLLQMRYRTQALDMSRWFAYWLIYDEYFRDPRFTDPITSDPNTGVRRYVRDFLDRDNPAFDSLINSYLFHPFDFAPAFFREDYFTSACPTPQQGDAVGIPMSLGFKDNEGDIARFVGVHQYDNYVDNPPYRYEFVGTDDLYNGSDADNYGQFINLSTIQDLRKAFSLQRFKEIGQRFFRNIKDVLKGHMDVDIPDARIDRPEYLGGSRIPMSISAIMNTAEGSSMSALGSEAGHATISGSGGHVQYSATEAGFIFCLVSIRPEPIYFQGIDRHLTRLDRFDFYWPEFQNIGMQPLYMKELAAIGEAERMDDEDPDKIFGYQTRYCEDKFMPNTLHGLFKSDFLDWTTARVLSSTKTALGQDFLNMDPDTVNRVFAYHNNEDHNFLFEHRFTISSLQKMQYYADSY